MKAIQNAWQIFAAALREIFDEAAYERYLAHHQLAASTTSYQAFRCEHENAKVRRPRCC